MGLFIQCSLVLSVFCLSPAQDVPEYMTHYGPNPARRFLALQTHMPTKQGNVPHIHPQEQPITQPKVKVDAAQLQREGQELLDLAQSLQADIDSLNHGLHPKDTVNKLKRIQKLAKHLREEIAP